MVESSTKFIVRYAETDQMGIVHHSNYPVWFEAGRTDFLRMLGMSYRDMEAEGILLPLIELNCRYLGAARYEDEITVKTFLKELKFSRAIFKYEVYRNSQPDIITSGETVHAFTLKSLKPVNLKKVNGKIYDLLIRALSAAAQ